MRNLETRDGMGDTGELDEPTPDPELAALDELDGDRPPAIAPDAFDDAFAESLETTLDLGTWLAGESLAEIYGRLEREVHEAAQQERVIRERVRGEVFPRLKDRPDAPPEAGVYQVSLERLEATHRGILFNGLVEGCDGTNDVVDHLPLTIVQIGVCLVSYRGDQGSWVHRLFRRDLRLSGGDPIDDVIDVLERRQRRAGFDKSGSKDRLSELARRGIMTYAERAVLLDKSTAPWRMGHGNPTPYELVTGSGMPELAERSFELLRRMVSDHQRFVFVPSAPANRFWLTLGDALRPLEYAIYDDMQEFLGRIAGGHYRGTDWDALKGSVEAFAQEIGGELRVGVYRASETAPAQVFYAHREHVHEAAVIAIADSVLQEHRGFPVLIDLADSVCRTTFGHGLLKRLSSVAYAEAGEPFRYLTERQTRT
jgi:hypothetical protein